MEASNEHRTAVQCKRNETLHKHLSECSGPRSYFDRENSHTDRNGCQDEISCTKLLHQETLVYKVAAPKIIGIEAGMKMLAGLFDSAQTSHRLRSTVLARASTNFPNEKYEHQKPCIRLVPVAPFWECRRLNPDKWDKQSPRRERLPMKKTAPYLIVEAWHNDTAHSSANVSTQP